MTVGELRAFLKTADQDAPVVASGGINGFTAVVTAHEVYLARNDRKRPDGIYGEYGPPRFSAGDWEDGGGVHEPDAGNPRGEWDLGAVWIGAGNAEDWE